MIHTIKIDNSPNICVQITFKPMASTMIFTGEYKPKNGEWEEILKQEHPITINEKRCQEILEGIYALMEKRIEDYNSAVVMIKEKFNLIGKK